MKNLARIFLLLSLLVSKGFSQNGDEWIESGAEYLKISVAKEGFYRIFPNDLSANSFDLSSIDPRSFRLLRRGKEWSIRVLGEQDGVFGTGDYVEFYAYPNDGESEKDLYVEGAQMHSYYSLYTDTAAYFLTWGGVSGKRIENITPSIQSQETNQILSERLTLHNQIYTSGYERLEETFLSNGDFGEGFVSSGIRNNNAANFDYTINNGPIGDGSAYVDVMLVGEYRNSRVVNLTLTSGTKTISVTTDTFSLYSSYVQRITLPIGFLSNVFSIKVAPISLDNKSDFVSLAYTKVVYNTSKNWTNVNAGMFFSIPSKSKSTLTLASGTNTFYLLNGKNTWSQVGTGNTSFVLSNDSDSIQTYYYRKGNAFINPSGLARAEFADNQTPVEYLIVTNKRLMQGALAFRDFKTSIEGGSRNAQIYDIEELYNTFSYGDKNPLAIKSLVKTQYDLGQAKALMILGRGLSPGYRENNSYYRKTPFNSSIFSFFEFVPTFGEPGSDLCFSQILEDKPYLPVLATGRLTANSNQMIFDYIDKLKDHAKVTYADTWTKNLLHLSGGKTTVEAGYFLSLILGFKNLAIEQYLGANVTLLSKQTFQPVELYNISEQVNNGVSLITYIGHSSPNTIEIDIGDASDPTNGYRNKGKYPVLFINGCNSLDVFNSYTRSENWVNATNRGAIAAFGHTRFGYTNTFNRYTRDFYSVAFQDSLYYGKSIGEIQLETINRYGNVAPNNFINYTQMQQFGLLGDPDIRLVVPKKADFLIKNSAISILPYRENESISSSVDSIKISFTISNWGLVRQDSIDVCISRVYNELSESIDYGTFRIATPAYEDVVEFNLFNKIPNSYGENIFQVFLDCGNAYDEYDESNNFLNYSYDMPSNRVKLLYPYEFAIEGESKIDFAVESQNQSAVNIGYILEISKNYDFQNLEVSKELIADNVAIFKGIELTPSSDTSTFYWRARLKEIPEGEEVLWQESSFTIISAKSGWGQFEYGQFRKDNLTRISDNGDELVYDSVSTRISFETVGKDFEGDYIYNTNIIVNDRTIMESLWHSGCNAPGFVLLPFDGGSLLSYKGKSNVPYSSCGLAPATTAHFSASNAGHRANMLSYLDSIPKGDYLFLLSTSNNALESLDANLLAMLGQFGCFSLDTLASGMPYVFIGRKGDSLPLYEKIGVDFSDKIESSYSIRDLVNSGEIIADNIGYSKGFSDWSWSFNGEENEVFTIDLLSEGNSIRADTSFEGKEELENYSIDLLSQKAVITDKENRSLSEIGHWALSYQIAPEGVVLPRINASFNEKYSSVYQGDSLKAKVSFLNVSTVAFDSVWLNWSLKDLSSGYEIIDSVLLSNLLAQDTLDYEFILYDPNLLGEIELSVTFNRYKQIEQDYSNNTLYQTIEVLADLVAPIVELRLNGEIPQTLTQSNGSPVIDVYIYDDNQKAVKSDTLGIEMFLSGPCTENEECIFVPVYFSDSIVSWSISNNQMHIQLLYANLTAGIYEFKVFGADAFGNVNQVPAGLSFVIEKETELSAFLPYPSPFSYEMRFAYQMKGLGQPKSVKIQILSSAGVLVYELDQTKLGELKPGSNLTQWSWDGTDYKGRMLPNGVYLYRVMVNDIDVKHLGTVADEKIIDGWGTILISR